MAGTLLKPERTQNPERAQNVLQLRSVLKPERTFVILSTKKVRSGFSTERDFQNFRFSTTYVLVLVKNVLDSKMYVLIFV